MPLVVRKGWIYEQSEFVKRSDIRVSSTEGREVESTGEVEGGPGRRPRRISSIVPAIPRFADVGLDIELRIDG